MTSRIRTSILFFFALATLVIASQAGDKNGRLAILSIENAAKSHSSFVSSMPTMIVTELMQRTGEQLVERSKIEEAMKELGLESNGVTTDGSVKIGQWVGAERILLGSFSELEGSYRLDLRIIEVASGRILAASQATVRNEIAQLIPAAVKNLGAFLTPKEQTSEESVSIHSALVQNNPSTVETGFLVIRHQIKLSLFTEKNVPFQKVRVYVDRRFAGESPVIKSVNEFYAVFDGKLDVGYHRILLEHGVVDKNGEWKRLLEEQPKEFAIEVYQNRKQVVEYTMKVNSARFEFLDFKIP